MTIWTVACQAPLSMEFSRQEQWSGFPFSSSRETSRPRDRTYVSCVSCTAGRFYTQWTIREACHQEEGDSIFLSENLGVMADPGAKGFNRDNLPLWGTCSSFSLVIPKGNLLTAPQHWQSSRNSSPSESQAISLLLECMTNQHLIEGDIQSCCGVKGLLHHTSPRPLLQAGDQ